MIFGLNFTFLSKYWFYYMDGLKVTLQLAFWTLILSSIVGVIMGMIRVQNYKREYEKISVNKILL